MASEKPTPVSVLTQRCGLKPVLHRSHSFWTMAKVRTTPSLCSPQTILLLHNLYLQYRTVECVFMFLCPSTSSNSLLSKHSFQMSILFYFVWFHFLKYSLGMSARFKLRVHILFLEAFIQSAHYYFSPGILLSTCNGSELCWTPLEQS